MFTITSDLETLRSCPSVVIAKTVTPQVELGFLSGAYPMIRDSANQALACFVWLPGQKRNQSTANALLITINKESLMVFATFCCD